MDLTTHYLGLDLAHPLMPGASPMVDDLGTVRRLEDAGASAIVMHSLFEEQIMAEEIAISTSIDAPMEAFAEALSYLPEPGEFSLGPDEYLEQIRSIREAVAVPLIASLNGTSEGRWLAYAQMIEEAGADALEINAYDVPTDPLIDAATLEGRLIEMVAAIKQRTALPVAVKLSAFHTTPVHFATRLVEAGADGLILFNRFYQPDIDVEELELERSLHLSTSAELPLRLHWLAILSCRVNTPLAITGGVHNSIDVVKAVMAGAHAVQVVSALLRNGPGHLRTMLTEFEEWLDEHRYDSLEGLRGSMNLLCCPDPTVYERVNYMRQLLAGPPSR